MEERLVLVHLRTGSGTDTCVSGVHIGCIAAGAPHCHIFLNPHETSSNSHELSCGDDPLRVCWPHPKAYGGSCPLNAPVASIRQSFGLPRPQRVVRSRWACCLRQQVERSCVRSTSALVDQLTQLMLGFLRISGHRVMHSPDVDLCRPWGRVPLCA